MTSATARRRTRSPSSILLETRRYGVSVLACEQERISTHFAGRPQESAEIAFVEAEATPLIADALTHVVADVVDGRATGDHTLFIGEVLHFDRRPGEPLIFHSGAYCSLLTSSRDPTQSVEWAGELHTWGLRLDRGPGR